ncbi:MAG: GspH/FimT family pseudopilin [Candidatus Zixiibacteriota bacterium]|nr:MAG: GspH/FimT family pseudopilin [candidate division Zixibacteria bacterium]
MKKRLISCRGITLMEIMIGVVIVSVVASMAVPSFQNAIERANFRSVNRDIVSDLRMARSRAISERESFGVHFDDLKRQVTFFLKVDSLTPDKYVIGTDSVVRIDTLEDELDFLSTLTDTVFASGTFVFSPNGSASTGGLIVTIKASPEYVGVGTVDILASTGRIKQLTWIW